MSDERKQRQFEQGSTGQRSKGEGGGHQQHDLPGKHGGQQGGKDLGQPRQGSGGDRPPGSDEAGGSRGGDRQRQQQQRERQLGETEGDEPGGRPASQGNLGTTQREWSGKDNTADSDER